MQVSRSAFVIVAAICVAMGTAAYVADHALYAPRDVARYLHHRAEGHRQLVIKLVGYISSVLNRMDRIRDVEIPSQLAWAGASVSLSNSNIVGSYREVRSTAELLAAVTVASPGDIIELQPGRYAIDGYGIRITRPGRPDAPIVVRADRLGTAVIESAAREAIKVSAPDWHFENLVIRGICNPQNDSDCEHAFHIVGAAKHTVLRNNILLDFNAQIKINGENDSFPDDGVIARNTLSNTRPRATINPVTPIDLDAASGWIVTGNLISDFIKSEGNAVSYGAFAKAAGFQNVFRRNVILCEDKLQGEPGERVGLSLGGGGSSPDIRRDGGRTGLEQDNSQISDNLIAFCSDAGIYLNRSERALVEHNTLLDTSGIVARFPQTSAHLGENIIDGIVAERDGASISANADDMPTPLELYLGIHPQRQLFVDPSHLDLRWQEVPPRGPSSDKRPDLCGAERALHPVLGAFESFVNCLQQAGASSPESLSPTNR